MKKQILSIVLAAATMLIVTNSYASGNESESSKGSIVHSVVDGRATTTAFDKKGKWIYTIEKYSLDNLDKNIIDRVQSVYYNYGVTGIEKIDQRGMNTVYVVHLENAKSIKLVRLTDDDIEVVQDLVKG
jgi:hypothetical protein